MSDPTVGSYTVELGAFKLKDVRVVMVKGLDKGEKVGREPKVFQGSEKEVVIHTGEGCRKVEKDQSPTRVLKTDPHRLIVNIQNIGKHRATI